MLPDIPLLGKALTHKSCGPDNNERLEFLGDAVLELITTNYLLERFPEANEGDLSKMRANIVSQENLAKGARKLRIPMYLRTIPTQFVEKDNLLEDALEAVIGAIYTDLGMEETQNFILKYVIDPATAEAVSDYKSQLQEIIQKLGYDPPVYTTTSITGPAHAQHFIVRVKLPAKSGGSLTVPGSGTSKKRAEQDAAKRALQHMTGELCTE